MTTSTKELAGFDGSGDITDWEQWGEELPESVGILERRMTHVSHLAGKVGLYGAGIGDMFTGFVAAGQRGVPELRHIADGPEASGADMLG
jgi:hypothetical protein